MFIQDEVSLKLCVNHLSIFMLYQRKRRQHNIVLSTVLEFSLTRENVEFLLEVKSFTWVKNIQKSTSCTRTKFVFKVLPKPI